MEVENRNYKPEISRAKGAQDAGWTAGGGGVGVVLGMLVSRALMARGVLPADGSMDELVVGVVATGVGSLVAGCRRWWRNRKKHKTKHIFHPLGSGIVLALLAVGGLCGCITTTMPDGTVVQRMDLESVRELYLLYVAEQERLERSGVQGDARAEARRQARLAELNEVLVNLRAELDRRGY